MVCLQVSTSKYKQRHITSTYQPHPMEETFWQSFSFLALTVYKWERFKNSWGRSEVRQLISYKTFCRTTLATAALLKRCQYQTIRLLKKNPSYGRHWHSRQMRIGAPGVRCQVSGVMCHLFSCHMSHVACRMSLTPTATVTAPTNSPTMHSRMVCKDLKINFTHGAISDQIFCPRSFIDGRNKTIKKCELGGERHT